MTFSCRVVFPSPAGHPAISPASQGLQRSLGDLVTWKHPGSPAGSGAAQRPATAATATGGSGALTDRSAASGKRRGSAAARPRSRSPAPSTVAASVSGAGSVAGGPHASPPVQFSQQFHPQAGPYAGQQQQYSAMQQPEAAPAADSPAMQAVQPALGALRRIVQRLDALEMKIDEHRYVAGHDIDARRWAGCFLMLRRRLTAR